MPDPSGQQSPPPSSGSAHRAVPPARPPDLPADPADPVDQFANPLLTGSIKKTYAGTDAGIRALDDQDEPPQPDR